MLEMGLAESVGPIQMGLKNQFIFWTSKALFATL